MEKVLVPFFNANEYILVVIVRKGRDGWLCVLNSFGLLQLSEFAFWPPLFVINQISFKNATPGKLDIGHINISEFLALLFSRDCFYLGFMEMR